MAGRPQTRMGQGSSNVSPPADVQAVLDVLMSISDEALTLVEQVATTVRTVFTADPTPRAADLGGVERVVAPALSRPDSRVHGAGFVAGADVLAGSEWWLEWFLRAADGAPQRLIAEAKQGVENFYDYAAQPWYTVPQQTGRAHVTGPYVDYLCTDDYTLTYTIPVHHDGMFVGVAGADVRVFTVESEVLPALRAVGRHLAVVNAHGRIVTSNSGRFVSGTMLRDLDVPALWPSAGSDGSPLHRVGQLPLALLDLERPPGSSSPA